MPIMLEVPNNINEEDLNKLKFDSVELDTKFLNIKARIRKMDDCKNEEWYNLLALEAAAVLDDVTETDSAYVITLLTRGGYHEPWTEVMVPDPEYVMPFMELMELDEGTGSYFDATEIAAHAGALIADHIENNVDDDTCLPLKDESNLYVRSNSIEITCSRTGEVTNILQSKYTTLLADMFTGKVGDNILYHNTIRKLHLFLNRRLIEIALEVANQPSEITGTYDKIRLAASIALTVNELKSADCSLSLIDMYSYDTPGYVVLMRPEKLDVKVLYKEGGGHFTTPYIDMDLPEIFATMLRNFNVTYVAVLLLTKGLENKQS